MILDAGYSMLDTGCEILDVGYRMVKIYSPLEKGVRGLFDIVSKLREGKG